VVGPYQPETITFSVHLGMNELHFSRLDKMAYFVVRIH